MRADFADYVDMASVVEQSVKCRNCGEQLFESVNTPVEARAKCPSCDSTARAFEVNVKASMKLDPSVLDLQKRDNKS